jgi:hypothetical protein
MSHYRGDSGPVAPGQLEEPIGIGTHCHPLATMTGTNRLGRPAAMRREPVTRNNRRNNRGQTSIKSESRQKKSPWQTRGFVFGWETRTRT